MKKHVLFGTICALCAALFAQPAFDNPNAKIIDVSALHGKGKAKDNIIVINATHEQNLQISVFGYVKKQNSWESYGTVTLKQVGDDEEVSTGVKSLSNGFKSLKRYSHFAIVPSTQVPFTVSPWLDDDDLFIGITSHEQVDESAYIIDVANIPGKFKDNVKFRYQGGCQYCI